MPFERAAAWQQHFDGRDAERMLRGFWNKARQVAAGLPFEEAIEAARRRIVFTTHTPVPAGNEVFSEGALRQVLGDLPAEIGTDWPRLLALGRVHPDDAGEPGGRAARLYVVAARARGLSRARTVVGHALRNSLIPVVTILGLQFGAVLTGTIITETIFAWPGVGRLLIQAISFRDYPLVQGCILFIAVTYVAVNLAVDVMYAWLDPRIRYQ